MAGPSSATSGGAGGGQEVAAAAAPLPLSLAMRRHTRKIHRRSDALVNVKLALAFTDRALYARAIALFQSIYERLEALLPKAAQKEPALRPLVELVFSGPSPLARSKAFEADLVFFLGPDWRRSALPDPRPAALETYLARLEEAPPVLLAVYAFHMYMALLSGGQILRRLARAALGLDKEQGGATGGGGTAMYEFGGAAATGDGVAGVKEQLRAVVDGLEEGVLARQQLGRGGGWEVEAATLRASLLEESLRVFLQNNAVVATFDTGRRGKQALLLLLVLALLVLGLLAFAGVWLIRGVVLGGAKG